MQILQTIFLKKGNWRSLSLLAMFVAFFVLTNSAFPQVTTLWEKSAKTSTLPQYFGSTTERGFAYGNVGGNHRIYVVSRAIGTNVVILDAATGDSVGTLSTTGIAGGDLALNDIEVDNDGVIYACNLATNPSTSAFKIYKWTSEAVDPVVALEYTGVTYRLGDKFSVVGSALNNTLAIYLASSASNKVVKFTTADNGTTFTPVEITLSDIATNPGTSPAVWPLGTGNADFWVNGYSITPRKYSSDGTALDTVLTGLIPTASTALRSFTYGGKTILANYITGSTTERNNIRFIDVTDPGSAAKIYNGMTSPLGTATNSSYTGDIAIKDNGNGTFDVFLIAPNNGIAAYRYYTAGLSDVVINSFPYFQGFESGLIPSVGWTTNLWQRGTETKTGSYCIRASYNYSPTVEAILVSPKIELPADHRITFWWKDDDITAKVAGHDTTFFEVSTDNGVNWTTLGFLSSASSQSAYVEAQYDLSAYAGNNVRLRWRDKTNASGSAYGVGLDDITIEPNPAVPKITVLPTTLNFGNVYVGGNKKSSFTVTNTGGGNLNVTITPPANVTVDNANFSLTGANSQIVNVTYTPADSGSFADSLLVASNDPDAPGIYVQLTATGKLPYTIINETFNDVTGSRPADWEGTFSVYATGGVENSKRLSRNLWSSTPSGYIATPVVNLVANAEFKFMYRVVDYTGYPSTPTAATSFMIIASISTDFGATFIPIDTIDADNHTASLDYVEKSYSLAAYNGDLIIVRLDGTRLAGDFYMDFDNIFVGTPPESVVDWCNLQWPATATITEGENVTVYAQAWINNVTNQPGVTPNLNAWIGISNSNTDPATWTTWVPAIYNVESGNNDEFMADIGGTLAPGTYYYASRFQYEGGPYRYGGYSSDKGGGFWNGTTNVSGVLTVNQYMVSDYPFTEGFEADNFPPAGWAVENLNAGSTWTRGTSTPRTGVGHAQYLYDSSVPGNDYLFTPALTFQQGKVYAITYWYRVHSGTYAESFAVTIGDAQNAAGVDSVLADHPGVINTAYLSNTIYYSPATTGLNYIGFHEYSTPDMWNLYIDDVEIIEVPEIDYAVTGLVQVNGIPTPFESALTLSKDQPMETVFDSKSAIAVPASDVNNSLLATEADINYGLQSFIDSNPFDGSKGYTPVNMKAHVKNNGLQTIAYQLGFSFNGVAGTPINRPGVPFTEVDTVEFSGTPTALGTFTTTGFVTAVGDSFSYNDTLSNFKTLVYPDPMVRIAYDNGPHVPNTFIGGGANNIPITAGVRFTAAENIALTNIDAYYRTESIEDSILVRVWAAGSDTLAPGTLLYSKNFAGENYLSPGDAGNYITLPLGEGAPVFLAGSDFWVSISFVSTILYPMGCHNAPLTTTGRSFISQNDGVAWSPLVISSTERAWLLRVVGTTYTPPLYSTVWERSRVTSNLPTWFSSGTERGIAFGYGGAAETNPRLYVASRNGGSVVKILDAGTGNDVGELNTTGITGSYYTVCDIEVSEDNKIFVGSMTLNASTTVFKVYKYDSETSTPVEVINTTITDAARLGDKITLVGNYSAGTAVLYAASASVGVNKVYKWTMSGGVFNTAPEVITLSDNATQTPTSACVTPLENGDFYFKATGMDVKKYTANGTLIASIPQTVVQSGANAIKYLGNKNNNEYFVVFQYGTTTENAKIVQVPVGDIPNAVVYATTPSLYNVSSGGTGDVAYRFYPDGTIDVFVISSNNGIGCYKTVESIPVELLSFAASVSGNDVVLNWSTATEANSQEFQVERRESDNGSWTSVGKVNATGTSTEVKNYSFTDKNVNSGKYSYRLKMVDFDGTFEYSQVATVEVGAPVSFALTQNYPNPFNPSTRIDYQLASDSKVTVELFDITGQKVATLINEDIKAGYYSYSLNTTSLRLSTGVYIYRMIAIDNSGKSFVDSKKLMLLK